jgi:hypothetical protein
MTLIKFRIKSGSQCQWLTFLGEIVVNGSRWMILACEAGPTAACKSGRTPATFSLDGGNHSRGERRSSRTGRPWPWNGRGPASKASMSGSYQTRPWRERIRTLGPPRERVGLARIRWARQAARHQSVDARHLVLPRSGSHPDRPVKGDQLAAATGQRTAKGCRLCSTSAPSGGRELGWRRGRNLVHDWVSTVVVLYRRRARGMLTASGCPQHQAIPCTLKETVHENWPVLPDPGSQTLDPVQ